MQVCIGLSRIEHLGLKYIFVNCAFCSVYFLCTHAVNISVAEKDTPACIILDKTQTVITCFGR